MKTFRYFVHGVNAPTNYEIAKQFDLKEDAMHHKKPCFVRVANRTREVRILDLYEIDQRILGFLKQENPTLQYQLFVQEGNGQIRSLPDFKAMRRKARKRRLMKKVRPLVNAF